MVWFFSDFELSNSIEITGYGTEEKLKRSENGFYWKFRMPCGTSGTSGAKGVLRDIWNNRYNYFGFLFFLTGASGTTGWKSHPNTFTILLTSLPPKFSMYILDCGRNGSSLVKHLKYAILLIESFTIAVLEIDFINLLMSGQNKIDTL